MAPLTILAKFHNLSQISQSWPNITIPAQLQNPSQISQFWQNFTISSKFHNCRQISQFWLREAVKKKPGYFTVRLNVRVDPSPPPYGQPARKISGFFFSDFPKLFAEKPDFCHGSLWSFRNRKHHGKHCAFPLTKQYFGDVFEKHLC